MWLLSCGRASDGEARCDEGGSENCRPNPRAILTTSRRVKGTVLGTRLVMGFPPSTEGAPERGQTVIRVPTGRWSA
jgi:hypothetical protein